MLPRLLALAASAASLAPQPQRALPTTLQRQAATAALAGAVVASPLAAVALSVDVTDINSPPVVDLPVLGRFGVSPSKAKPTVKVSGDLVGTALSAKDGKVKVTVSTPKIGPLPALDDEVLDIRIASSPGTVGVSISNPAIPKLPVGGGTSDWNVVQNLGSGATYYFNSKTGVTQYANPVAPSPKPAKKAAAPAVPAAAAPAAATAVAAKAALKYAKRKGYAPARLALATDERPYRGSDGTGPLAFGLYADELLGFALAAFGAKVQFTKGFRLPPLLKLLLLPARLVEGFLAVAFVGLA